MKKTLPSAPHFDRDIIEGKVVGKGGGTATAIETSAPTATASKSLADRVRERINPEEPDAPPPRDRKRPNLRDGKKGKGKKGKK